MLSVLLLASFLLQHSSSAANTDNKFQTIASEADKARESERLNDALNLYSEGVKLRPTWVDGWWWLGSILYEQDRFAEALIPFEKFVALSPNGAPALAFLALCEYETGDYEKSLKHFRMWSRDGSPGNDALLDVAGYRWALLLTRNGQFNQALFILAAKAQKLGPSPNLTEAMGLASLRLSVLPQECPPEKREAVWLAGSAAAYSALSEYPWANDYTQRLLAHHGNEANVHYFRGTLFTFQKDWDSAAGEYEKELEISPTNAPALVELAVARLEGFQPGESLAPARQAVALDPGSARGHYILGRALQETGSWSESVPELEEARALAPDSARVRYLLFTVYKHLGRAEDAKRELKAFQALKDKEEVLAPLDEKLKAPTKPGNNP
jgi:tetratricopeptide (TPR) repeat protein